MFSKQRKNFFQSKWFYLIIVILLLLFGIWINYGSDSQKETPIEEVSQQKQVETGDSAATESHEQKTSQDKQEATTDESGETQQAYYLIREIEGVVKVFHCDENGEESLYQITTIPFQLLSQEDQQLLAEGVHVQTEAELADFLENFDS